MALAIIVVALVAWGGFPPVFNVGEKGEAIAVKLGNPDGEDLPLKVSSTPDPAMQAVMSAQRVSAASTVVETREVATSNDPGAVPVKATKDTSPASTPPAKAVPAPTTAAKPTTQAAPAQADQPVVTEKVIRGSEKGNASELVLKPQGEKISQNAYWPVYLFMPLPAKLDGGLLARVVGNNLYTAEERRSLLLQFYTRGTEGLSLTTDPGLPVRPAIWSILEGAGYDVGNADYKRNNVLTPVVISFRIGTPKSPTDNPDLLEVKLESSSGNKAVDDAVLYAFQKSTFANGSGQIAEGRYTYDFTGKK